MIRLIYLLLGVILGTFISLWSVPYSVSPSLDEYTTVETKDGVTYITKLPYMDCVNQSSVVK